VVYVGLFGRWAREFWGLFGFVLFYMFLPAVGFARKGLGSQNTASVTHQAKVIHSTINPWDS